MSLVGNFAFSNDKSEQLNGPTLHRAVSARRREEDWSNSSKSLSRSNSLDSQRTVTEEGTTDAHIGQLARQLSQAPQSKDGKLLPFFAEKGSELDPNSENFSGRAWIKSLMQIVEHDPDRYPQRASGLAFKNLSVHGFSANAEYQKTVGNIFFQTWDAIRNILGAKKQKVQILKNFVGVLEKGEMLVVLGPPGSGCTTLLKAISGQTQGFTVEESSQFNYRGISVEDMQHRFRGEVIYTAEVDEHFPQLTVGDTLTFAARARSHRHLPEGIKREEFAEHMKDVTMAVLGIAHTKNTKVGSEYVRGVSGGERKRVTIAEAALAGCQLQCWDNSTRGLDSANSIEFCKTLRTASELTGSASVVAIYQAPQAAYDQFDKVTILYEGRQIFFGKATDAQRFFVDMGFHKPERQTTPDFLTSLTSPAERRIREGFEMKVPRTPDEFAQAWQSSAEYKQLLQSIDEYDKRHAIKGEDYEQFKASVKTQKAKHARAKSPYTLSYGQQVALCLRRGIWRLKADPSLTASQLFGNQAMALIVSSVFYNLPQTTDSFYSRGALIFFAILLNAFSSALEILTLYAQRPIVDKHARYAFYHRSAEAFASMLVDMPYKIVNSICFNLILYFMANLNRQPGNFFFFLFVSFLATLVMSMIFRTIGSASRSLSQALAPAAVLILGLVLYTGFAVPTTYMLGWARWINYLDPIAYAFEALMINEFAGQNYACSTYVPSGPGYDAVTGVNRVCSAVGAQAGEDFVSGNTYINLSYAYYASHKWRNVGIMFGFIVFFMFTYLIAAEFITEKKSKGEILLFRRGHVPESLKQDEETGPSEKQSLEKNGAAKADAIIERQTAIFHFENVHYTVKIKDEERTILNNINGYIKPGTLTALMGSSGAGKTTLLDVLANRVSTGVISGNMMVNGSQRSESFQRKTGYCQQQDLHLETSTVREALIFSALLRQPKTTPKKEKLDYVEEVIKLLEMEAYADAVVGVPGTGLNVEQRKRLTIGVEMVAKPELLLFLDEPTSGLDSQTSWSILDLLVKLRDNGQALLVVIHQPSAMLFQRFDRLLFLAKGGRTTYFGEIGENAKTLTDYFHRNGAPECTSDMNPAEYMLSAIGAAPGSHTDKDWHEIWKKSPECEKVQRELDQMREELPAKAKAATSGTKEADHEFAAPFWTQYVEVQKRVWLQYWRTPSYIFSKTALCALSALFIGFSLFKAGTSQQGLQNQMFGVFLLFTIFGQLVQQIMPHFVAQRSLYEVRERASKTYSWKVFMLSNIVAEIPYQFAMAIIIFFCWYYPIGLYQNAVPTSEVHLRGALMFLLILQFMIFTSTFTHMVIAGLPTAETAGNIANLMFSLTLIFCGVLANPSTLGWWVFMYRVSPFTYLVDAMLSVGLANNQVVCSSTEFRVFQPPSGQTCGQYLANYLGGGYLADSSATSDCQLCPIATTNAFLSSISSSYSLKWRNFGILWAYILFNVGAAVFIYWLVRVPKKPKKKQTKSQ